MKSTFDAERLKQLLKDFYTVVGIRISVFDDEFNLVTEYPETPPFFCAVIREKKEGLSACKECDRAAFLRAKTQNNAHLYTCHAGLSEAITPIHLDGYVVGYAIFAHLLPAEGGEKRIEDICRRSAKYFKNKDEMINAIRQIPTHPAAVIASSMRLLEAISAFLQISNVAKWSDKDTIYQIEKFINENLSDNLTSELICTHFFISRTKLYQLCIERFGMSVMQYITELRLNKAKKLLADTDLNIAAIADKVGVPDYNYFCKMFKKHVGATPGKYRKDNKEFLRKKE